MDHTHGPDDVVRDATGATTTVRSLTDLAFWHFLEPGQTETHDALRMHLMTEHKNHAATGLTDAEALEQHDHEHHGPGGIRNHDPASTNWSQDAGLGMLLDAAGDFSDSDEDDGAAGGRAQLFNAHLRRLSDPGHAGMKRRTTAPAIFQDVTRYTVSIFPHEHPSRRYYQINVTMIGPTWVIEHLNEWYSSRTGHWLVNSSTNFAECTYPSEEMALELARELAPVVQAGNGRTALEALNDSEAKRS